MNFVATSLLLKKSLIEANPVSLTDQHLTDQHLTDQQMLADLAVAIVRSELTIVYQPQINLVTGQIIGVDALVRWSHQGCGQIQPSRFIPLAETSRLIHDLGAWVLQQACREAASWTASIAGAQAPTLTVNVSPWQMQEMGFATIVQNSLANSNLPPEQLILELACPIISSNNALLPQISIGQIITTMQHLRRQGIKLALGSCGIGSNTIRLLSQLPLDRLTLDRDFVQQVSVDPEVEANFYTIMNLAKRLRIPVMASGVETIDQIEFLSWHGCRIFQGYWYSPPFNTSELKRRLAMRH
jgi:EAL domain-containing protein (putative c-di-GMP-specific phosphodiesterase class I)